MSDGESTQPVRKSRRWIIALLLLLGLGSGSVVAIAAYFYKENVTQIDRRYPTVVAEEYLRAALNNRDDARASLYTCGDAGQLLAIRDLRSSLEEQERMHGLSTSVSVTSSKSTGASVEVELQIRQQAGGVTTKELQRWQFTMIQDDGWRVCGAQRLPDPKPSPSAVASASSAVVGSASSVTSWLGGGGFSPVWRKSS